MKTKFLTFFTLIFFLYSCWWWSSLSKEGLVTFDWDWFEIGIPENWNTLKKWDEWFPRAWVWEVTLASSSQNLMHWFANNILILSQDLNKQTTSQNFSQLNNVWAQRNYLEYTRLNSKTIDFNDGSTSTLYEFEAKYNTSTPKLKFLQVWKVCNYNRGHLITIAISTEVRDTSIYEELIKTFKCN